MNENKAPIILRDEDGNISRLDRRGIPLTWAEFFMSLVIFGMLCLGGGYYWNYKHTANFFDSSVAILQGKYKHLCEEFGKLEVEVGIARGKHLVKKNAKGN